MHEMYRDFPITELRYSTPFQCLIAVMMSAQTTDVQVNKVTDVLYTKIKSPADVLEMWEETLGEYIRTVGLRTAKKRNIYATSKILVAGSWQLIADSSNLQDDKLNNKSVTLKESATKWKMKEESREDCHPELVEGCEAQDLHDSVFDLSTQRIVFKDSQDVLDRCGYWLPDTLEGMMELPGVWVKTAKVVLYVLYRQRRVAVDTHVHRVMNRLWVVDTKTPDQSSTQLETIIPDEYKDIAHHSIIYFGRYHCKAKKPECGICVLHKKCKRYGENKIE